MCLFCLDLEMFVVNLKYLPLWLTGIIEVSLNRPGARNAIGTELLRGLKHTFETISEDSSANVVMISSSVPKVFCAGADLKVRYQLLFLCIITILITEISRVYFFILNAMQSEYNQLPFLEKNYKSEEKSLVMKLYWKLKL